jgi:hypothetical protein
MIGLADQVAEEHLELSLTTLLRLAHFTRAVKRDTHPFGSVEIRELGVVSLVQYRAAASSIFFGSWDIAAEE